MLTMLHTPTAYPGQGGDQRRPVGGPGRRTRTRPYRSTPPRTGEGAAGGHCIPNGIELDAGGPTRRSGPIPDWPSGPPGSRRRRGCPWRSRHAGRPACGWRSPARSPTGPTSTARSRRCSGRRRPLRRPSQPRRAAGFLRRGGVSCPRRLGRAVRTRPGGSDGLRYPGRRLPRGAAHEVVSAAWWRAGGPQRAPALASAIRQAARLDRQAVRASVLRFDHRVMVGAYEKLLTQLVAAATASPVVPIEDALAS